MHTYRPQLTFLAALFLFSSFGIPALAQHQSHDHHDLLEIQQAFVRGEMDVNEAALRQFRLIFEADAYTDNHQKCATPAFIFLKNHRNELSSQTLQKIDSLAKTKARADVTMQHSYISPSGKFEIHYDSSGPDAVPAEDLNNNGLPDYVEKTAFSADSSYRHEVLTLGFSDPIPEGFQYDVYLQNMGFYGVTSEGDSNFPCNTDNVETCIYIENDFVGFPANTHPEGHAIGALYATMAHEFKHAIQYQQNRWGLPIRSNDWIEMDATLMEEVVFDDVNDYYNYIKRTLDGQEPNLESLFYNPARSAPVAYNYVSWMIYYSEVFGNEFWVDVWDLIEENNLIGIDEAMIQTLPFYGADFGQELVRNHLWHFASGENAPTSNYGFEEKSDYPTPNLDESLIGTPSEQISIDDINELAARYIEVVPEPNDRGYVNLAVDFDSTQIGLGALIYLKTGEVLERAAAGRDKPQVYLPNDIVWEDVERVGIVITNFDLSEATRNLSLSVGSSDYTIEIRDPDYLDLPEEIAVYQNYPNPFNPRTTIAFDLNEPARVNLEVYDITGRKVKSLLNRFLQVGRYEEEFDGSGLSSGVYLYRLKIGNKVHVKKMTLIK
ncbi:T9SS type A sorting domain-containing protein [Gracilimonas mengyeensis]|uniref:Por secretion system C-terminal sorting domain-containing protein n=1 Tax=Gracilimonas mengyeensis TaxID=1302730 RepID=A0A521DDE6_9BACT|nr:T9SS type A sorting domain-containing protein [Gracilimonas mengyeensis]SMO69824.1 Por secretion system C-terminal sorting domain-containing protein [Gracilimonas mengyeensis]